MVLGNELKAPTKTFEELGGSTWRILRFSDELDKKWSAFNPSIAYSPVYGYSVLFRSSNYFLDPETTSAVVTTNSRVQSRMWLAQLTSDWTVDKGTLREIDFSSAGIQFRRGAEDGRLYWRDGGWEITAGIHEPGFELPRIARFRVYDYVAKLIEVYQDGSLFDVEKNWMSTYEQNPHFDFVYTAADVYKRGHGPLRVREPSERIRHVRGGSQLWELTDGRYVAIVHEADVKKVKIYIPRMFTSRDVAVRTYVHRFAIYDKTGKLTGLGPRFKLSDARIEFAAGLVVDSDDIIVSYGYKDVASYLGRINLNVVLESIEEV